LPDKTPLSGQDEQAIVRGLQVLQKVSRRIAQFTDDHKLFQSFSKQFVYDGKDHQETLLGHARVLTDFLKEKKSQSYRTYAFPSLDNVYGFL